LKQGRLLPLYRIYYLPYLDNHWDISLDLFFPRHPPSCANFLEELPPPLKKDAAGCFR
jgi:hypothetical protein